MDLEPYTHGEIAGLSPGTVEAIKKVMASRGVDATSNSNGGEVDGNTREPLIVIVNQESASTPAITTPAGLDQHHQNVYETPVVTTGTNHTGVIAILVAAFMLVVIIAIIAVSCANTPPAPPTPVVRDDNPSCLFLC